MFSYLFSKRSLGIEITTKCVRFVYLVQKGNLLHVKNFGTIPFSQGVFLEGDLQNPHEVTHILKNILKNNPSSCVRVGLPGDSQRFFTLSLANYNSKTLIEEIIFRLKEHVVFYQEKDEIVDIRTIQKKKDSIQLRVVVASREWCIKFKQILDIFKGTKVHIERTNQAAILASFQEKQKAPRMHVQFGDDYGSYSVVHNGRVVLYQEFPFSTHTFLYDVQKMLTTPSDTASQYLSHLGVYGADVRDYSTRVLQSIAVLLDHAILEYGKNNQESLKKITLGGVFAGYPGVSNVLSQNLRMEVVPAYPWKTFDPRFDESIFEMTKQETLEYLVCLGLSLGGV